MRQERLFRLAAEAGVVAFHHVPGAGWELSIRVRRGDEAWADVEGEVFSRLTTIELLDVVSAALDSAL